MHLEFFLTLNDFKSFHERMNKSNMQNNIIDGISSFQTGLFTSAGFYFKSRVMEGNLEMKNGF